jgi:NTE family protein
VARALYEDDQFAPDIIAGVSIGAIAAALLARPAGGMKPVDARNAFWQKVAVPGSAYQPPLGRYASVFGNPNFFVPRLDYLTLPTWTYLYHVRPLRHTLSQLLDLGALADPRCLPHLLVSATDVEGGEINISTAPNRV